MLIVLLLSFASSEKNYHQKENWSQFKLTIPESMLNQNIVINLNKESSLVPLLLLAKYKTFPIFNYSYSTNTWHADADFNDFQSWISKSALSSNIKITNVTFLELYIGIYKNSTDEISYLLSIALSSDSCLRTCKNSECHKSLCECKGFNSIGEDCGTFAETISPNKKKHLSLDTEEWKFLRIFSSKKELTLSVSLKTPNFHIFIYNSDTPSQLPGIFSNDFNAFIVKPEKILIKNHSKKYWLISIYCISNQGCDATLELESSSSSDSTLTTIIIVSIVCFIFLIAILPIVIKHLYICRKSNPPTASIVIIKRNISELDNRFPSFKYKPSTEDINCIICLENIKNNSVTRKLSCNHIYHTNCIDEWHATNSFCPLCKKSILLNEITSIQDD